MCTTTIIIILGLYKFHNKKVGNTYCLVANNILKLYFKYTNPNNQPKFKECILNTLTHLATVNTFNNVKNQSVLCFTNF